MMFKKVLTKSGRRILKAIKSISTARFANKFQQQQQQEQCKKQLKEERWVNWCLQSRLYELLEGHSLTTKSVDTLLAYVPEYLLPDGYCCVPHCCCYCDERDENQWNENLENEMMR